MDMGGVSDPYVKVSNLLIFFRNLIWFGKCTVLNFWSGRHIEKAEREISDFCHKNDPIKLFH